MSIEEQQIERPFGSVTADRQAIELWMLDKTLSSFGMWQRDKAGDVQDRVQRGKELLLTQARLAVDFASGYITGRFLELERVLAKNPDQATRYATEVIKGRFLQAESLIAEDPALAVRYARDVIKGRFLEAEEGIAASAEEAEEYCDLCVHLFDYTAAALHPYFAYRYAKDVIKGKLPPRLHKKMQLWAMSDEHKGNEYLQHYLNSKKYQ